MSVDPATPFCQKKKPPRPVPAASTGTAREANRTTREEGDLRISTPRALFVSLLFVASGAVGLAYEVTWFRRFTHVWGSSGVALAAVVGSFLGGLGLGAWILGRVADRLRRPLRAYALAELGVGVLALLVPFEIAALIDLVARLGPTLAQWPVVRATLRLVATFAVLGPPSFLMGGTLPFLLAAFGRGAGTLRDAAGWLYAVNSLGATLGCLAAGFWLLPRFGLGTSQFLIAGASLVIAAFAFVVSRRERLGEMALAPPARGGEPKGDEIGAGGGSAAETSLGALRSAAALAGFAALVLETVWMRHLAVLVGGSTYAFAAGLAVFLFGIGAGSLLYHLALRRRSRLALAPILVIAWIAATTWIGHALRAPLADAVGMLRPLRASFALDATVSLGVSAALELAPALGMGLLFPLILHVGAPRARAAPSALGTLYALNTLGAIAGAALGALVLVPLLGTAGSTSAALGVYALAVLVLSPPLDGMRRVVELCAILSIVFAAAFLCARAGDPRATQLGQYLYGFVGADDRPEEVLYFREGAHASVLVTELGSVRSLRVNGKVDASSQGDMTMQLGSAYFPLFLAPDSRRALVIGFGSGTTAGALLLAPGLEVACAEIESAVVEASEHFAAVNHRPTESARFRAIIDDGRSWLAATRERFDLVVSEPSNPWLAGLANLYTREFYELVRERLEPGGVLAQWIQTYAFTIAEYALVVRTVRSVFPHALLVRISEGDTVLLASDRELVPDAARCERAQEFVDAQPEIAADLLVHFGTRDVRALFLRHLFLDAGGLDRLVALDPSDAIHRDLDLRLEFDAPRRVFRRPEASEIVDARLFAALPSDFHATLVGRFGTGLEYRGDVERFVADLRAHGRADAARELVVAMLERAPDDVRLLAAELIAVPVDRDADFDARFERLRTRDAGTPATDALAQAAKGLFDAGRHERAVRVFREVLARAPNSATAWANLGHALAALGRAAEAEEAFVRAVTSDPLSRFARRSSDEREVGKEHEERQERGADRDRAP